jgi:nucleoid-associated protein YgaU
VREGAKLLRERKAKWRALGCAKSADWQDRIAAEVKRQFEEARKDPPRLSDAKAAAIVEGIKRS